jgi:hypothetical protein
VSACYGLLFLFLFPFLFLAPINHQGEACHIFLRLLFTFSLQALQSGFLFRRCHGSNIIKWAVFLFFPQGKARRKKRRRKMPKMKLIIFFAKLGG